MEKAAATIAKGALLPGAGIDEVRKRRFVFLRHMDNSEIGNALKKLKDRSPEERINGAKILGSLKATGGFAAIVRALDVEKEDRVKIAFLKCIREMEIGASAPAPIKDLKPLKNLIRAEKYEVAKEAVWAFAVSGKMTAVLDFLASLTVGKATHPLGDARLYKEVAGAFLRVDSR